MNVRDEDFKELLTNYKKIAVYGLSPDPKKPSHYVPVYMREQGYDVVGIYPKKHDVGGFQIYENLADVPPEYRKFLDVFRSSDKVPQVIDEILATGGVEVLWLQLGISHPEAEKRAEKAGIKVVSDRCLIIEHKKWFT